MDAHIRAWILHYVETHNDDECIAFLNIEDEEGESFDDFVDAPVSEEDRAALEALWADHAAHVFEWDAAVNLIPF